MRFGKNSATGEDRNLRGTGRIEVVVCSPDPRTLCNNIRLGESEGL